MRWFLLDGNRLVVAGGLVVGVFVVIVGFEALGIVTVGPASSIRTILSSGMTSGLLALITVSLTINQLLLSRVFGPIESLEDRLDGAIAFRQTVEDLADRSSSPTDPTEFLVLVTGTIATEADAVRAGVSGCDPEVRGDVETAIARVVEYADRITPEDRGRSSSIDTLSTLLGSAYADRLVEVRRLRAEYPDRLPSDVVAALDSIERLLRAIAILRQFLKTVTIQQDLARLSRLVAYSGFVALVVTNVLALVYTQNSGALLEPATLRWVAAAGLAIAISPLAVLVTYLLRVATVSRYTVSAGPFVPPEERFDEP